MKIHFVLAANNSSSQTRVTVEYANQLVRRGQEVTVSVSRFDFFDFVLWHLAREGRKSRSRMGFFRQWVSWLALPWLRSLLVPRPWFGQKGHRLDPRVRVNRYGCVPRTGNMPEADVVVAFQCYLLPHLLYLHPSRGRVVGSIRLDYAAGAADPVEEVAEWREFCNSFYQRLNLPLFAVSRRALESAQRMGVTVDTVIQNGVNTEEFTDSGRRGTARPLQITLFTHDHPQKGREFGCAVIQKVRQQVKGRAEIQFCSAGGNVKPEHHSLFDRHYGYLTGAEYVRMFQETDIFIFPSQYEGFPAVPLEAMACGCALATTRVSGVVEYAQHGLNCMTAPPGDAARMTENVLELIRDARLRDSLRDAGVRTAASYSWSAAADKLAAFLEQEARNDSRPVPAPPVGIGHWVPHKEVAL